MCFKDILDVFKYNKVQNITARKYHIKVFMLFVKRLKQKHMYLKIRFGAGCIIGAHSTTVKTLIVINSTSKYLFHG